MKRQSNFELLRILSILMVIGVHLWADVTSGDNGYDYYLCHTVYEVANDCFILISGYFGITYSLKKMLKLNNTTTFYAILSLVILLVCGQEGLSKMDVVKAVLPIPMNTYWFITSYMILMLLSPYINKMCDAFTKEQHSRLMTILIVIFFGIPTVLNVDYFGTAGFNVVNMTVIYIIGRYIRLHSNGERDRQEIGGLLIMGFALQFALYMLVYVVFKVENHFYMFGTESSLTILVNAILMFMLFKEFKISSKFINAIGKRAFAVYLSEMAVHIALFKLFDKTMIMGHRYLAFIVLALQIVIFVICIVIDCIKTLLTERLENKILDKICNRAE